MLAPLLISSSLLVLSGCEYNGTPPLDSVEHASQGSFDSKLSANGSSALIASIHHGGSFWKISDKKRLYNWNHTAGQYTTITALALSADGSTALTADGNRLVAWESANGRSVGYWNTPADILSLALSSNGRFALVGLRDYTAIYLDISSGSIISSLQHDDNVRTVAITADGGLGLTGSDDGAAKLWVLEKGKMIRKWQHQFAVNLVALSADGKRAFTASQSDRAFIRDPRKDEVLHEMSLRGVAYSAARFSSDGASLLLGNSNRQVQLWDITAKKKLEQWTAPKKSLWKPSGALVHDIAFGDKNTIQATTSDGMTYIWNSSR